MFETSMVLAPARPVRRMGVLTVSLVAHSAAIVGALALSVASTDFPEQAPRETAIFLPAQPPPPLGNPDGGAPPRRAAAPPPPRTEAAAPPAQITAPPSVPDTVPLVEGPAGDSTTTGPVGSQPGPVGVPWGDPNGVGELDAPPAAAPAAPVEQKIYEVGSGVTAPVAIHKVQPPYPQSMIRIGMPATVVVRCVIDKFGRVRDPQVVVAAMPPFNDEVIRAVKQWRFTPGSLRGEAVEVYLDLTVHFSVKR